MTTDPAPLSPPSGHGRLCAPLFEPFTSSGLELANRIVMAPMTRSHSPGGTPGADVAAYYRRRAEGGVGLIVTEGVGIDHPSAVDGPRIPLLHGPAVEGWRHVVSEVHAAGGRIVPQLWHQGVMRDRATAADPQVESSRPSGLWGPLGKHSLKADYLERAMPPTRPMTESEIADVIAAYARSAANAKAAGFDGVAVHGAHGYLIDSFLWGETNKRTDRWGGGHRERARFGAEVVAAIRGAVGPGLPIVFRFSQHKSQDYTARTAETPKALEDLLVPLAEAGVDIFDGSLRRIDTPTFEGSPLNTAGWAKKLTGKPTISGGGIGVSTVLHEMFATGDVAAVDNLEPAMARFARGDFDLLSVGRSLISDPQFARRLRTGEPFLPFDKAALARLS
ncbi:NADH:flavin oxidoreductase [Phenylobacterium sp.]|uniref:NADH:flavin oxidoreductase n=1 Tax=Phenylobacterium sp. TaxID=1871053 RepID=UPI002F42A046